MSRILDNVRNRPVFIILHGSSIGQLEAYIPRLKGKKICYMGLNRFEIVEKHILSRIGERFSMIHCHANPGLEEATPSLVRFLKREDENVLMTTRYAASFFNSKYPNFISEFREKIWLTTDFQHLKMNSLTAFLACLMTEGVKNIILFGADGCSDKSRRGQISSYYHPETFSPERTCELTRDTGRFNSLFPAVRKDYSKNGTRILNCSPGSHITCIPIIRYEDLHRHI